MTEHRQMTSPTQNLNVILLAAGRGSRLSPMTDSIPKSLVPVCGVPVLQYIIDEALLRRPRQIVLVCGYQATVVESFAKTRYQGAISLAVNDQYERDINILSAEIGVSALEHPDAGYLIIETDTIVESAGWEMIFQGTLLPHSFWVTRGRYSPQLTGGALKADATGQVEGIVYAPEFSPRFLGWQKLIGTLYVAADQVPADRALRQAAIKQTIGQYYMTPWVQNLAALPCKALDLGELFAGSFNDMSAYQRLEQDYARRIGALENI